MGNSGVTEKIDLVPPPGGRIHIVRVPVDFNSDWQEAMEDANIVLRGSHRDLRKISDCYPSSDRGISETKIVLLNFDIKDNAEDNAERVKAWSQANVFIWACCINDLKLTEPRHIFAIAKHLPNLNDELRMEDGDMTVYATKDSIWDECRILCSVNWRRYPKGCLKLGGLTRMARWLGLDGSAFWPSEWLAFAYP